MSRYDQIKRRYQVVFTMNSGKPLKPIPMKTISMAEAVDQAEKLCRETGQISYVKQPRSVTVTRLSWPTRKEK